MKYDSPVGTITLTADDRSIIGLWIEGQRYFADTIGGEPRYGRPNAVLKEGTEWLDDYFAGHRPKPSSLSLAPIGSEFRQSVWNVLEEIPYGQVTSYAKVAAAVAGRMGRERMSCQAVGGAVGRNPISIIIPCHRVIGSDGNLTGYSGGLDTKVRLLQMEGVDTSLFFRPR